MLRQPDDKRLRGWVSSDSVGRGQVIDPDSQKLEPRLGTSLKFTAEDEIDLDENGPLVAGLRARITALERKLGL